MSKIIADDAAFECALKDGAANVRLKKDAARPDPLKVIHVLREDLARSGSGEGCQNEPHALHTGTDYRDAAPN